MRKGLAAAAVGLVMVLALASGFVGCSRPVTEWQNRAGLRVVVTIPALDNFVRNVGGEHVGVICLCTSVGPHQYEHTVKDAVLLREANLFLAIGLTLDDKFADQIQLHSHNPKLQYVKLGERLPPKLLLKNEEHGKEEGHAHEHGHEHGDTDPHVWLGIPQAIGLVEIIRDELKKLDEAHASDFDKNATRYIEVLKKLQTDGQAKLKDKKEPRKLIAFHESLRYFAKCFDLEIVDVLEVSPGNEPTPNHVAKLVAKCKKENVRVIAVEPQYPKTSSAEVLRKEDPDLQLVVVDPLETADNKDLKEDGRELKSPEWYERKMRQNLDALAKGLP